MECNLTPPSYSCTYLKISTSRTLTTFCTYPFDSVSILLTLTLLITPCLTPMEARVSHFIILSLLVATLCTSPSGWKRNVSPGFKLHSTSNNTVFAGLFLDSYHIYPGTNHFFSARKEMLRYKGFDYAVLQARTDEVPGLTGYLNGTAADFRKRTADLVFNGNDFPYGFVINAFNSTYQPVEIIAENGTRGVYTQRGVLKYNHPQSEGFYGKSQVSMGETFGRP